ncbi:hypothetical protein PIB30_000212 [Stylosanthes scabra]|uniref:Uncharacterized protein n=1 Tax=Stylosanthes scabra TaxID=79078 RepID=A0ABU6S251_9FABA|nr:hypothetical protein [Stylosanthes scabra]
MAAFLSQPVGLGSFAAIYAFILYTYSMNPQIRNELAKIGTLPDRTSNSSVNLGVVNFNIRLTALFQIGPLLQSWSYNNIQSFVPYPTCSVANAESGKPNSVQVWIVAVNPTAESSTEQAGRGGEPAKHSDDKGIYRLKCTRDGDNGEVHVQGFRSSAREHISYSVAKERSCHIPFVEGTSGRVSPAGPNRLFLVNRPRYP